MSYDYTLHLLIFFSIYTVIALGLNLAMGWLGRITLAHASLVAVGAYGYALLTLKAGFGMLPTIGIVLALGAFASLLLSLPSWRFRGDYFVMITLAVHAVVYGIVRNWFSPHAEVGSIQNLTNGTFGISGVPKPAIFGYKFATIGGICIIYVGLAVLTSLLFLRLTRGPWGRLLTCIRDDELALRGLGKPVRLLKIEAFAVSGALAALGGAMYAGYMGFVDPAIASLDESILWLSIVVVGGLGTLRGSIVGSFVILLIPELLRITPLSTTMAANLRYLAYGLLLVSMMHLRPQGLAGEYKVE
jgi:branched-chain amino acid transport system permease protein